MSIRNQRMNQREKKMNPRVIDKERFDKAARELFFWQQDSEATNFHAKLFDLIAKADAENYGKLLIGFPEECVAWAEWQGSGDYGNNFFRKYRIMKERVSGDQRKNDGTFS